MSYIGTNKIDKLYLGNIQIGKAYLGSTLVYEELPYDSEVEYLQSSGTQYIQLTSLNVTSGTFFAAGGHIIPIYTNTNKYKIFGANPNTQFVSQFYSYTSSTNRITYSSTIGGTSGAGGLVFTVGTKSFFEFSTLGKTSSSGTFTSFERPLTNTITGFRIFGGYSSTTRYPIKICDFYIKVGDSKIFDLIAVRVGQVGYMYDKISKQLFGNSGSGSFTLGNDI